MNIRSSFGWWYVVCTILMFLGFQLGLFLIFRAYLDSDTAYSLMFATLIFSVFVASLLCLWILIWMQRWTIPLKKLQQAALAIAAGNWGETVPMVGSEEVKGLAQSFNTMSVCLQETMKRLQEAGLEKRSWFNEMEAFFLLQHWLMNESLETLNKLKFNMSILDCGTQQNGWLCHADEKKRQMWLTYTHHNDFEELVNWLISTVAQNELPQNGDSCLKIELNDSHQWTLSQRVGLPPLFIWNPNQGGRFWDEGQLNTSPDDVIICYTSELTKLFSSSEELMMFFSRTLKLFRKDEMLMAETALANELKFIGKKYKAPRNLTLVIMQWL